MRFPLAFLPLLLLVLPSALPAQTNVSGTFGLDQHWTLAGSPYVVTGNYRILPGTTLQIDAGVSVSFAGAFSILVQGGIQANGTAAQPITISTANSPVALHLDSLDVNACRLDHVHFSGGNLGLLVSGAASASNTIQSTGCRFQGAGITVHQRYMDFELVKAALQDAQVVVSSDVFTDSRLTFNESQFSRCTFMINDSETQSAYTNLEIAASKLHQCTFIGSLVSAPLALEMQDDTLYTCVFRMAGAALDADDCAFVDCFFGNQGLGLQSPRSYAASFSDSRLMNCGLTLSDSATIGSLVLSECLIQNDGQAGIQVDVVDLNHAALVGAGSGTGLITHAGLVQECLIQGHADGIHFNLQDFVSTFDAVGCNFLENRDYHMVCDSSIAGQAYQCWWQSTDTAQIEAMILDAQDNPLLGSVTYVPFNLLPDPDAPISVPRGLIDNGGAGNHLLTWLLNPEADLKGYRLHHGSWNGFAYAQATDLGLVTSALIPDSIFQAGFAITAYDSSANGNRDQVRGHESGYAKLGLFPVSIPGTEDAQAPRLAVFPVPASDVLHLRLDRNVQGLRATLFDLTGRAVKSQQGAGLEMTWDVEALPAGIYLLRVEAGKWSDSRKLVVRR